MNNPSECNPCPVTEKKSCFWQSGVWVDMVLSHKNTAVINHFNTFAGVLREKICICVSFNKILKHNISEERLITAVYNIYILSEFSFKEVSGASKV